jgi:hypothetical protein
MKPSGIEPATFRLVAQCLQRVGPTRNNTELYLHIANTVKDLNATKLPALVTPIPTVKYAQGLQEIAHHDPDQYRKQLTVYMHQTTQPRL